MTNNVYYNPEKFGLTIVVHADAGESYAFDDFIVWKDANDRYYWAEDSGCSCPIPFEGLGLNDLRTGTARDALVDLAAWGDDGFNRGARPTEAKIAGDRLKKLAEVVS